MKNLQKAGGIAALIAAGTYLFAMGLLVSLLGPMADPSLGFQEHMAFLTAHKGLVFVWHSVMYFVNGICLVVLVPALYERLETGLAAAGPGRLGLRVSMDSLRFLSGVITNYGTEAPITLYGKNQAQAETLKIALDAVTLGIDSSDRLLGGLWVGLASLAAFKGRGVPESRRLLRSGNRRGRPCRDRDPTPGVPRLPLRGRRDLLVGGGRHPDAPETGLTEPGNH
ncbi:MAG: hypothetical protein M0C28_23435 [Candidatus Moduliflexus flocculans]|nr:hypothetical protein [Candidatus Moduliflexus flocculans]